ncbi:MAG: glycoside hydrolase family 57 protein [bacterium]
MGGKLHFVLHSHLPYVLGHGTWPHGTDWLFEAAAETYIPLLREFGKLDNEGVPYHLSVGLTPILSEQLAHRQFIGGFESYLEQKIVDARQNREAFVAIGDKAMADLAEMWENEYSSVKLFFEQNLRRDIISGFRKLQDDGKLEIITCAATHGYLPLLGTDESVRAQVMAGIDSYKRLFGRDPKGIWMPECAYRPAYEWKPPVGNYPAFERKGVEEILFEAGIEWTVADSHLLIGGEAKGVYIDRYSSLKALWARFSESYTATENVEKDTLKPYMVSSTGAPKGTAFFFRDPDTSLQVWSGEWGYPGNPAYLDFHKKHFPGGHRYWRVTDSEADLADKEIYRPDWIEGTIREQASHFAGLVVDKLADGGILTAPFDAELFGHWWFEGPRWLAQVAREIAKAEDVEMTSGSEALRLAPPTEVLRVPEGSWGQGGFHYIWLNEWTEWTWKHIYKAENRMAKLVEDWAEKGSDKRIGEILTQAGRELLLLESSDWQFLISTWSARDYADIRVGFHVDAFEQLAGMAETLLDGGSLSQEDHTRYVLLSEQDNPFPNLNLMHWRTKR